MLRGVGRPAAVVLAFALLAPSTFRAQSPYGTTWEREGSIGVSAVALGLGAWFVQDALTPLSPGQINGLSRADVNVLDRGATYRMSERAAAASDWLLYALIAAPVAMLADQTIRDDWETYLLMYAETLALNGAVGELVKGVARRTRPYVFNPAVPMEEKIAVGSRKSFYSNHTSFAFASAAFLATTLTDYRGGLSGFAPYGVGLAFAGAATVGVLRYVSGNHFPTDILVGAAVGSLLGWAIPALHRGDGRTGAPAMAVSFSLPL